MCKVHYSSQDILERFECFLCFSHGNGTHNIGIVWIWQSKSVARFNKFNPKIQDTILWYDSSSFCIWFVLMRIACLMLLIIIACVTFVPCGYWFWWPNSSTVFSSSSINLTPSDVTWSKKKSYNAFASGLIATTESLHTTMLIMSYWSICKLSGVASWSWVQASATLLLSDETQNFGKCYYFEFVDNILINTPI